MKKAFILVALLIPCITLAKNSKLKAIDMPIERFVLDNGLTVVISQDHKAPIVAVNVTYKVGSKDEPKGRQGFAHLFEHLMFQGSENFDDEYFHGTELLGATDLNGTTSFDRTNYFQTVPKNALDGILWLESDRMGHFVKSITQAKLDEQRNVVLNEKKSGENAPYNGVFLKHVAQAIYPKGHPYSWFPIGSEEDLNNATLTDVKNWFTSYYGPNNAYLTIVGDVDVEETLEKVKKYFGHIPASEKPFQYREWVAKRTQTKRDIAFDQVPLARIYKIWNVPSIQNRDIDTLDFLTNVLSSGKSSLLYKRLVYEKQMASDVSAQLMPLELSSIFIISVTAKEGITLKAIESELNLLINELIKKGIDKNTLQTIKMDEYVTYIRAMERVGNFSGKAALLANFEVFLGDANKYKDSFDRFVSTTSKDLQRVASQWLGSGDYILEIHPKPNHSHSKIKADRTTLPLPKETIETKFPTVEKLTLENGIEVFHVQRDSIPFVQMQLSMEGGSNQDPKNQLGLTRLMMDMLDEGTKKMDLFDLERRLSLIGSSISSGANETHSYLSISSLDKNLNQTLELAKEVLFSPRLDAKELDRLKKQTLETILKSQADPRSLAKNIFFQKIFPADHPYGHSPLGTADGVSSIEIEDIQGWATKIIQPNGAKIYSIGSISSSELKKHLDKTFKNWKPKNNTFQKPPIPKNKKTQIYLVDRPQAPQTMIYTGLIVDREDMHQNIISNMVYEILGNDFTSRINMNLREDKGWSYGIRSGLSNFFDYGVYRIAGSVQTDKTAESIQEIRKEINDILNKRKSSQLELSKHRNRILLSLTGTWETNGSVLSHVIAQAQNDYPLDFYQQFPSLLSKVTLDQVHERATSLLNPDEWTWVLVGDLKVIEKDIKKLNWADVTIITP